MQGGWGWGALCGCFSLPSHAVPASPPFPRLGEVPDSGLLVPALGGCGQFVRRALHRKAWGTLQSLATLLSGASHTLCGSQFFHALASYMQLPPPGTFLPNFVELQNLQVWVQRSLLSEAFLGPSSGPLQPPVPLMVPIPPINHPLITQGSEARGQGTGAAPFCVPRVCQRASGEAQGSWGLGLNP